MWAARVQAAAIAASGAAAYVAERVFVRAVLTHDGALKRCVRSTRSSGGLHVTVMIPVAFEGGNP